MVLRMTVGLALTVVALAVAGRRLWWLKRLAFTGQPAPERVAAVREHPGPGRGGPGHRGDRAAQAAEVVGARRGARGHVLGLHRPAADDHRGLRRPVLPDLRHPRDRPLGLHRVHRGPVRRRRAGRHHHLHRDPAAQQPAQGRPQVTVLRLAHRRRLGRPGDDLPGDRDAAALPGRADQHRRVPVRARRVRLPDRRALAAPAGHRGEQRAGGGVHPRPRSPWSWPSRSSWSTPSTCTSRWPR